MYKVYTVGHVSAQATHGLAVLYLREWHEALQLCVGRDNTLIVLEMRNWTLGYAKKAF